MHPAAWISSAVAILLVFALPAAHEAPPAPDLAGATLGVPGTLDLTFGGGYVTALTSPAHARTVATQSDGRVIAAGDQNGQWAVARFDALGNLDSNFGTAGVTTLFGATSNVDWVSDVAIDASDRIVLVGRRFTSSTDPLTVVRLTPNGALDSSFGNGGVVETPIGKGGWSTGVAIQLDGKIVVSGWAQKKRTHVFAVARYDQDGTLDTTFGDRAKKNLRKGYTLHIDGQPSEGVITLDGNGRIVLGGPNGYSNEDSWVLTRYTTAGAVDTTFGNDGVVSTTFSDTEWVRMSGLGYHNGRLYASGRCFKTLLSDWDTLIAAYTASGTLDTGFGATGYVVSGEPGTDNGNALAIQSDGKPVVAAQIPTAGQDSAFALFRFNSNGTRDATFGSNGLSQLADGTVPAGVFAIGLDPWGDIFAAGTAADSAGYQFRIAKWFQ